MGIQIGVVGHSGTGKTTSLRNLNAKETFYVSPYKATLPFPHGDYIMRKADGSNTDVANFVVPNTAPDPQITALPSIVDYVNENRSDIRTLVIDDITHMFNNYTLGMQFQSLGGTDQSWSRWGRFGAHVFQGLFDATKGLREDLDIIMMFHPEEYATPQGPKLKIRTPGKLIDREVDIPSYFNYLFFSTVEPYDKDDPGKERYKFVTNDDGFHSAKTPFMCFAEMYIPNDMAAIISHIKAYKQKTTNQ